MPAISKIRIVNFSYNDGKRLIPDELFVFENKEHKCVDTLINLHNGGGKSVIIQLIMQNILPKTTLQGRKIESYFNKSTDHSFVLIEWQLENSYNRLMTGVALAAGLNADSGSNSTVRYFNFICSYDMKGSKNDILSIPLSSRENGRFKAIGFEEARTYIKNKMEYYSSDDSRMYYDRLKQFGIMRSEWEKILCPINNREGGVEDFFKNCKSTDALLNTFIIPGVCGDTAVKHRDDESSMETMFRNYAGSYADRKDMIALRDDTVEFVKSLEEVSPSVEELWNTWSEYNSAVEKMYDYVYSVKICIKDLDDRKVNIEAETDTLKNRLEHIRLEELSKQYYLYKDEYDILDKQCKEEHDRIDNLKEDKEQSEHYRDVLNASDCYRKLCEYENKRDAVAKQLEEKNKQNNNPYMQSLGYSLKMVTERCIAENDSKINTLNDKIEGYRTALEEKTSYYNELQGLIKEKEAEANKQCGIKCEREKTIDNSMNRLGMHITKLLDGSYSETDILKVKAELEGKYQELCRQEADIKNKIEDLEKQLENFNAKTIDCKLGLSDLERELSDVLNNIQAYKDMLVKVYSVYDEWNISREKLFTDELHNLLIDKYAECESDIHIAEKSVERLNEQLECANNGRLHITSSVHSYLMGLNIDYKTGEEYLLAQNENMREKILADNPTVAYSIIVSDDKERNIFISNVRDEFWLSALLPIYTYRDLASMADGNFIYDENIIAAYSKDYFTNNEGYVTALENKIGNLKNELKLKRSKFNSIKNQLGLLSEFNYDESYYTGLVNKQNTLNKEKAELKNTIQGLKMSIDECNVKNRELSSRVADFGAEKAKSEQKMQRFSELTESIAEYAVVCEKYSVIKQELLKNMNVYNAVGKELDELKQKADEYEQKLNACKALALDYEKTLLLIKNSEKCEITEGDYYSLKTKYDEFSANAQKDIQELKSQLEQYIEEVNRKEAELQRFNIAFDEYKEVVFSRTELDNVLDKITRLATRIGELQEVYGELSKKLGKAESNVERQLDDIKKRNAQPLPKAEIGDAIESRRKECDTVLSELAKQFEKVKIRIAELQSEYKTKSRNIDRYKIEYQPKALDIDCINGDKLEDDIEALLRNLHKRENMFSKMIQSNLSEYADRNPIFKSTVDAILTYAGNDDESREKYYTLYERLPADIMRYKQKIASLEINLADIDSSKNQLVKNCTERAKSLYLNLKVLVNKSAVTIYGSRKNMLKINLPNVDDEALATRSIDRHIEQCVKEYVTLSLDTTLAQSVRDKHIAKSVDMRKLLNCYIGTERIEVSVYKIDRTPQSSRYRMWENAIVENSGGEKFIVFFALLLSMMNYSRGVVESRDKSSGVLIMDNPFGPISSGHLLQPMFAIAKHFNIQLICFSHLDTAEITACFSNVCRLKTKRQALGDKEILQAESEQQELEHAFFRSEQMTLF